MTDEATTIRLSAKDAQSLWRLLKPLWSTTFEHSGETHILSQDIDASTLILSPETEISRLAALAEQLRTHTEHHSTQPIVTTTNTILSLFDFSNTLQYTGQQIVESNLPSSDYPSDLPSKFVLGAAFGEAARTIEGKDTTLTVAATQIIVAHTFRQ